ncbi:MAG: HslU--HslV peptidase proteolytic subunit, partial [Pseudomonas sp.]
MNRIRAFIAPQCGDFPLTTIVSVR